MKKFNKRLGTSKSEQEVFTNKAPQNIKNKYFINGVCFKRRERKASDDLSDLEDAIGVPENEKLFKRKGGK